MGTIAKLRTGTTIPSERRGEPVSPPQWLVNWRIEEPLNIGAEQCAAALVTAERACRPADPKLIGLELERTLALFQSKQPDNWDRDALADAYLEAFDDLPPDLVLEACYRVRRSFRFGFPLPGDFRVQILDELHERKHLLAKARLAVNRRRDPPAEREPPTAAEKAAIAAKLAESIGSRAARRRHAEPPPVTKADLAKVREQSRTFVLRSEDDPEVQRFLATMGA